MEMLDNRHRRLGNDFPINLPFSFNLSPALTPSKFPLSPVENSPTLSQQLDGDVRISL